MKTLTLILFLVIGHLSFGQTDSDKVQIETTLNHYIDAFYTGDTTALKKALRPRLYKFGYWKNKDTKAYEYYADMSYTDAMAFVQKMKDEGRSRDENEIREIQVLDIAKHIATAKVIAAWGIDFMTLSKDNGQWRIEQVIWEGPYTSDYKKKTTCYYLIRHAEKDRSDPTNKNPHLTEAGFKRADKWSTVFNNVHFDAIYSTDYFRTKETAAPTAKAKNLDIKIYDPKRMDISAFLTETKGKTVLIVGHSNTTPALANEILGNETYQHIEDTNNANLYIITINNQLKNSSLLIVD
jgi:phosphohistidine phosphatase SixA